MRQVCRRLVVLLASGAAAAMAAGPAFLQLKVEVEPKARVTKHVLIVLDRSGSMQGDPLAEAVGVVSRFMAEPVDELQVGIPAFGDGHDRWPGVPEPDAPKPVPPGWAAFPSKDAMEKASEWLKTCTAKGGTNVAPALRKAMDEPRKELTVLLVSDGKFADVQTAIIPALMAEAQAERERMGWGKVVVACYGIGGREDSMAAIGRMGDGGYFRDVPETTEEEEAPAPDVQTVPHPPGPPPLPVPHPQPPVQGQQR